ncbi:MAG: CPBP family intramembrane metalloprotease [Bacteroidales bacterium]|nr:CPBP family intramembrane metalloprotease [Bacteroidales bacterium]
MKKLLTSSIEFIKDDFDISLYLKVILYTAALIFIEYKFSAYSIFADKYVYSNLIYIINFIAFSIAYYGVVIILITDKSNTIKLSRTFWLKSLISIATASLYIGYFGYNGITTSISYPARQFCFYTANNLSGIFTLLIPVTLIYFIFDRNKNIPFYGLSIKNFDYKLALQLSIIAILIAFIGSRFQSVSEYYPILERTSYKLFAQELSAPSWLTAIIFEFAYMFDFVMIELFFRGLMIFGFTKVFGKRAILPVACLYAAIHFGKPLPETISSFFGAYLLGIVALNQKNIGIGVVLHCVLAASMEVFAIS